MDSPLENRKNRLNNIELLRILSMLMVVTLHFLGRGGANTEAELFSGAYFVTSVWDGTSMVCVDVYVLISGYFLVTSRFKWQKLLRIIVQVFTYSFGFYILFVVLGQASFSFSGLLNACLPLLTGQYWFASVYVGMYILFPFVNKALQAMNEKQHRILCLVLFALFTLYLPSTALVVNGYGIAWMLALYVFGAYLRLYYKPAGKLNWKIIFFYFAPTILLPLSRFGIDFANQFLPLDLSAYSKFFYKNNSVFVCLSAVALLVVFLNVKIKSHFAARIIQAVAPMTFGVYLVHNNPTIRDWLWQTLHPTAYLNKPWFFLYGFGIILMLFVMSAAIEFVRSRLYDKWETSKLWSRICVAFEAFGKKKFPSANG